jgi:hypothetical protein
MIAYQEYNTKSPLNGLAAKWAAQNPHLLPVDPRNIAPPSAGNGEKAVAAAASQQSASLPTALPAAPPAPSSPADDPWAEKIVIS